MTHAASPAGTVRAAAVQRMADTPGATGLPALVRFAFTPDGLEAAVSGTQRQRETAFDFLMAAFTGPGGGEPWECQESRDGSGHRLRLRFTRPLPSPRADARPPG